MVAIANWSQIRHHEHILRTERLHNPLLLFHVWYRVLDSLEVKIQFSVFYCPSGWHSPLDLADHCIQVMVGLAVTIESEFLLKSQTHCCQA